MAKANYTGPAVLLGGGIAGAYLAPLAGPKAGLVRGVSVGAAVIGAAWLLDQLVNKGGVSQVVKDFFGVKNEGASEVISPGAPPVLVLTPGGSLVEKPPVLPTDQLTGTKGKKVHATILEPSKGGKAYRGAFQSTFPVEMQVANNTNESQFVASIEFQLDVPEPVGDDPYKAYTLAKNEDGTVLQMTLAPLEVKKVTSLVDFKNTNTLLLEGGAAYVALAVYVNGKFSTTTYFFVW